MIKIYPYNSNILNDTNFWFYLHNRLFLFTIIRYLKNRYSNLCIAFRRRAWLVYHLVSFLTKFSQLPELPNLLIWSGDSSFSYFSPDTKSPDFRSWFLRFSTDFPDLYFSLLAIASDIELIKKIKKNHRSY